MIEVCLLGTGGMMPLPHRWLTSMMLRYNGASILVDCGEGTQIALKEKGWSPKPIDVMLFTHFHADHISGLPGMLLTMGNAERTEPLLIVGPKGVERVVESLRMIARDIPFEIKYKELKANEESFEACGLKVNAYKVCHNVTCYGYSFELDRAGRFDAQRAKDAGIELCYWNRLQKGEVITTEDGRILTPEMVLGPSRKGLKLAYCTDTRPTDVIVKYAEGADLFICEGMYGEPDKLAKAKEHKHMTFYEAAELAKRADVKEMWLTHYSPSLPNPKAYTNDVREIFPQTVVAKDGRTVELKFVED
ncbi:MAG: ribonuclease Z [Lachnospiraceae bacterium]|nr:ribonuclease Z [Candidatus Colinaster scatohippi]